jgi:hypothetical protein
LSSRSINRGDASLDADVCTIARTHGVAMRFAA